MEEVDILVTIGQRLKSRRNKLDMTQAQLSYKVETDPSYIRKVESGKVNISISKLHEIVTALDISLSELLESI